MRKIFFILLFVSVLPFTSNAEPLLDIDDFLISQDFASSEQNYPSIAVGLNGKFAVIWSDMRAGNGDVFCRLYDSGASAITDEFILNDDNISAWQLEPEMSSDWSGNYYAVWKDYRNNAFPFDPDVYYQKLDSTGTIGTNLNITTELPDSSHQSPAIGSTGWGKTVIAWADLRNNNWDVFAQLLDINGSTIGTNHRVNDDASVTPQHEPDIALSPDGWYVVSWYDRRNGNDDVFLQKFDSSGSPVGSNLMVNENIGTTRQKFPSVAIGGNGTILVVWTDWRHGTYPANSDIYLQRYDSDLNKIGNNIRLNYDGSGTSQKDPEIASDRMGNACVIWSDSTTTGWNVKAQMLDNNGTFRDENFIVNTHEEGDQLLGDVALDGYHMYVTWVDNRNGHFDIYGRVIQYNNPSLLTSPNRIDISIDQSDPDPDPQTLIIQNAGYGELDYRVSSNQSWVILSKSSGSTPDSFVVAINPNGLSNGTHTAQISLIDVTHNDSTAFIPVTFTITGPMIDISEDSLTFRALAELGAPAGQTILINNSSTGALDWELIVSDLWITTDVTSGTDGDPVVVGCDIASLSSGSYSGFVIVSDTGAVNSPESLMVSLELFSDIPNLAPNPAFLELNLTQGESLDDSIQIINNGGGSSNWEATKYDTWMTLSVSGGGDDDYLPYSIGSSLSPGYYNDSLQISDNTAFNNPVYIPVNLAVNSFDTIVASPVNTETGSLFQAQVYLNALSTIESGLLTLSYESVYLQIDSILPTTTDLSGHISSSINIDSARFSITISQPSPDSMISPGNYHLCDIYGTANDTIGATTSFSAVSTENMFFLRSEAGNPYPPFLNAGNIEISDPTYTDDWEDNLVPALYSLSQNYPNPFNNSTNIGFSLERTSLAKLELFNILGQRVKTLIEMELSAGEHVVGWDGRDDFGEMTASGIYFYRLTTPAYQAVKKMIFLK
ncbi:MAG: T9SS type A sorting domain-containing protein [candidate division Zixibacteria bacterium]|nr:T9SS type A sorting domain-containing protein [candidate division Zixibacteria bacterium]